jgi:hypothetical protein
MSVRPIHPGGGPHGSEPNRLAKATDGHGPGAAAPGRASDPGRQAPVPPEAPQDRVEVSDTARALVGESPPAAGDSAAASRISPERLREVLSRLEHGFYDRADVRDTVARKLEKDLDA